MTVEEMVGAAKKLSDSAAGGARETKADNQAVLGLRGEFLPHNLLFH